MSSKHIVKNAICGIVHKKILIFTELLKEFLKPSPKKESKSWHQQNSSKNSSFQKNSDLNGSESCFNGDIRLTLL